MVRPSLLTVAVGIVTGLLLYVLFILPPLHEAAVVEDEQNQNKGAQLPENVLVGMSATDIDGREIQLERFSNKLVLVVNMASKCGFTELNYRELQALQAQYGDYLTILAFPCNQFGFQEPGSHEEIKKFARFYGATFPLFSKVEVNGPGAHPFYKHLKETMGVDQIAWNFEKFLLSQGGLPLRHYDHRFPFEVIKRHIALLASISIPQE